MSQAAFFADQKPALATDQMPKAHATLVARAALVGVQLVRLADGSWLATKFGLFKALPDDETVDAWLRRMEGQSA